MSDSPEWETERVIDLCDGNAVNVSLDLHAVIFSVASGHVNEALQRYSWTLYPLIRDCLDSDDVQSADRALWCLGVIIEGIYGIPRPCYFRAFSLEAEKLVPVDPNWRFVQRTFGSDCSLIDLTLVSPALSSFLRSVYEQRSQPIQDFLLKACHVIMPKINGMTFHEASPNHRTLISRRSWLCFVRRIQTQAQISTVSCFLSF
jgi:hypothetical protein